ncbi:MAG: GAF domain-containing protein, partial [Chloroflexi bacterium]|nr:GAF domain-containing protein [Chloroflexota bacterium]
AALDRVRLQEATGQNLRRRLQELDAISRVSNELATTLEFDRVLDVIRQEATQATDAGGSSIALLLPPADWTEPDQPRLERRIGERQLSEKRALALADIEIQAIKQGTDPVIVEDYQQSQTVRALPENVRSAVAAAFVYEERVVGVIHLYHNDPFHFDERAATFLMTLAAKASLSYGNNLRYLENQERSDRLRRRVEQLNQIFELGQMLQSNVDTGTILEAIAFSVQTSIGFDVVMLMMVDEENGILRRVAQAGLPIDTFEESKKNILPIRTVQDLFQNETFRVSESYFLPFQQVSQWYVEGLEAISTGQGVTRTMHPHAKDDWYDGDMLIVPLFGAGGNMLGLMSLDRPFNDKRPDRNTIEILEIFAHQAATTLENTRLYMTTVRNAEQEARLNEVMEAIASTLDMTEIIETIARGVLRLLPFMRMTVALLESEQQGFDMVTVTVKLDDSLVTVRDHRTSLTNTALMRTFEEGRDYLYGIDDPDNYEDLATWHTLGERTSLIVPLITGGICLGAMHIGSDLTQAFGFEEFRPLIKRIANLSAVAIQNANLFNQAVNLRLFNESVVESIQQGIIVLDNTQRILTINDFMRRRMQWTNAARKPLFDYRPALRPLLAETLNHVIADGEPKELLNQAVREAGQALIQNFYLYPLRSANNVRGVVVLVDDVTERTRLEQDLAARANQLTALTEISSRITAALKRDEVVDLAMDEMQRVIDYDVMSLWRREGDELVLEAARGFEMDADETRIAIASHERLKEVVESRQAVSIHHFEGRDLLPGEAGLQSWLAAPLVRQRDVLGVIALGKRAETFYDKQAEQAMFAFANQVAVALVNADLFQETGARTERLSLLNRVSIALAQSLDTENIMEIALREIAQLLRIEKARAYIFERDTNAARVVVEYPRGDAPPSNIIDLRGSAVFEHVIHTSVPLVIGDISQYEGDEAVRQEIQRQSFSAYVVIPLTVGGQVSGVVELEGYSGTREFEPEKLELSVIIANQAAIAVLNANLLEQTLVRTRELETLLEAAQATSYTLDLDEVFSSVVRLALQALDMDDGSIMLYDNVDESLKVELDLNRQGDRNRITPSGTIYDLNLYPAKSRALREGQIIVIKQEDPDADMKELAEMAESQETARMLVPLISREQSIGLLQIELQSQLRTFTHREIRMAQALGAQAATAIENARLSTQTSLLVEQSLVINDISRTISSTMNTDDMIDIVRQQIPSLTDAEEIVVALYNPQTEYITFPLALKNGRDIEMPPRKMGDDEFSFVLRTHRPVAMGGDNPTAAEVRRNLKIITDVDASRFLGVPLMAGDQIAGVLAVRDTKQTRPFGLNDNRILTTIAAQLGATLQNALLFERVRNFAAELNQRVEERTVELQEERDRLNSLYQITAELGRTLDTDRVLSRALEMVAHAINADEGVVLLIDAQTDQLYSRSVLGSNALPAVSNGTNGNHHDDDPLIHPAQKLGDWLIAHERSVLVEDLAETDYWEVPSLWHGAIGVVLETNEDVQGVMIFLGRERGQFTDPHLKLVIAAANQVAAAVNNADLYNLIREQNDRMATLLRTEQEEAEKNSAILEGIADGVLLADATGVVVLYNSAAETILGLPRDYTLGLPLSRIAGAYGGTAQWVTALDAWVMNPRRDAQDELLLDRLEVGSRVVSVHASPVYNGEEFLGTVSVFRDVTRDVEVDRMKSEFISNVSHELRTPMTSIKGYADLLIGGTAGDISDVQKRFLGTIKGNADRLADLVNDLLNISRIDSGRERLKLEPVQVDEVARQVISSLQSRPQFDAKGITVTMDIDADVPAIKADHLKLVQILTNLLDNAFNYTYPGGKIEIAAARQEDHPGNVVIAVKDSGIGIPEAFRSKIWDRFERYEEHALVMEVAGTGLGLPIVKTLVEMHDGEVWFESQENKGTTFYVSLPIGGPEQVQMTSEQTPVEG